MSSESVQEPAKEPGYLLSLLGALVAAVGLAVLVGRFHPGGYIPMLMPLIIGWGVSTVVVWTERRARGYSDGRALAIVVSCSLLAYVSYHGIVYGRVISYLSTHIPTLLEQAVMDPNVQIHHWLEERTGHQGLLAYIAFVSEGDGADLSPLGLLGNMQPGLMGTLLAMVTEFLLVAGSSVVLLRLRCPAPPVLRSNQVLEEIARVTEANLIPVLRAMDAQDFERAGQLLAVGGDDPDFAVVLRYAPHGTDPWLVEIRALDRTGSDAVRARRYVSSWDGQALLDELKLTVGRSVETGGLPPEGRQPSLGNVSTR
ncbi:MAG: hypothetical protein VX938_02690 [Myxococcota bacterium]|nr:hypothetical protein [Myxococcota bacterium]